MIENEQLFQSKCSGGEELLEEERFFMAEDLFRQALNYTDKPSDISWVQGRIDMCKSGQERIGREI